MERHEVLAALKSLRLYGMASALEEAVATGIKRNRSPWEVLAELVTAEAAERKVRSIRYQMATAKFPLAKDLAGFDFASSPANEHDWCVTCTTGTSWKRPATSSSWAARAPARATSPPRSA